MAIKDSAASRGRDDTRVALAELSSRLDAIDADYHDLRTAVVGLGKRIDEMGNAINAKIDQRSQPQWQTYIGGAMLLGGLFFAFISPIQQNQVMLAAAIKDGVTEHRAFVKEVTDTLDRRNELFVGQKEHQEYKLRVDNSLVDLRRDLSTIDVRIDQRLDHIETMMFGRTMTK